MIKLEYILTFVFFELFFLISVISQAQKNEITPNGYNIFRYPDKSVSSEGMMKNGQPEGVWKSYYPNGKMKSEGKRVGEKLDSIWSFYDETGLISKKISYNNGMKNGFYFIYQQVKDSLKTSNVLISKELYLEDARNGKSFYYEKDGKLSHTTLYQNNRKHGEEIFFGNDGRIILILKYNQGNLTDSEKLNRLDNFGKKQGIWKDFYSNGKIKIYANYVDNLLNGYYREYDEQGQVIVNKRYINGNQIEVTDIKEENKKEIKIAKYANGQIKSRGAFIEDKPVGMQIYYSETGDIEKAENFDDSGNKDSEGLIDEAGRKQGNWKNFYSTQVVQSEGKYINGRKDGLWLFYFQNRKTEQKGSYANGKPTGNWFWFYENGSKRREGAFENGLENGFFAEFNEFGDTLSQGNYALGKKSGLWKIHVNDHIEIGNFANDKETGEWKYFYADGTPEYTGNYTDGQPDGKQKFFYTSGKIKETSEYVMGIRTKLQKQYDEQGNLSTVTEYRNGKKYKIDGKKVKSFKDN